LQAFLDFLRQNMKASRDRPHLQRDQVR